MTVPFFKLRQFRSNKCCPTHSKQLHPDLAIFTEYIDRRCIRYLISADVYRPTNGAVRLRITLTIVYLPAGKQKSCQGPTKDTSIRSHSSIDQLIDSPPL
ncbi:hypothetical protein VTN96DRAFT_10242 [Rasamsonia emersonii]